MRLRLFALDTQVVVIVQFCAQHFQRRTVPDFFSENGVSLFEDFFHSVRFVNIYVDEQALPYIGVDFYKQIFFLRRYYGVDFIIHSECVVCKQRVYSFGFHFLIRAYVARILHT